MYYILIPNIKKLKTLAAILNHPDRMYKDGGKIALEWISRFEKTVSEYIDATIAIGYVDSKNNNNTLPVDDSNSNNDFLIDI